MATTEVRRTVGLAPRLFVSAALLLALACGETAPVSAPGTLTATLESPNGAEGAALIKMVGGQISSISPLTGDLHTSVLGDTMKVLVLLDTSGEIAFSLSVADTTLPPVTTILEVADGENQLRTRLDDYRVRFRP